MKIKINNTDSIDLPKLIAGKLLVQANSGGGKSWLIRRLIEQAYGKVQIIILDPEGEFSTLREKFDFVLAGKGGDIPTDSKSAALLARRTLEHGYSLICDLYELPPQERKHFVRLFLDSMVNAPKELYHNVLVVLDEAHMFVPEKDESEAASAVIDMASRGRKRGYSLVLATQRISKLNKDAAAECNNKLIGRTSLDIDRKRAADELGITDKEKVLALRSLEPGEFFAFGPAISSEVIKVKVGDVETSIPKAGQHFKVVPPTEAVRKILAKITDIPAEAKKEVETIQSLKNEIRELRKKGDVHKFTVKQTYQPDPKHIEKEVAKAIFARDKGWITKINPLRKLFKDLDANAKSLKILSDQLMDNMERVNNPVFFQPIGSTSSDAPINVYRGGYHQTPFTPHSSGLNTNPAFESDLMKAAQSTDFPDDGGDKINILTTPEKKILNAIAWLNNIGVDEPDQTAVSFLAGYSVNGGGFKNPRGSLRVKGLIEYRGNNLVLTENGRQHAEIPDRSLTTEELHSKILTVLPNPERKLMEIVLASYPEGISNEELAERSGYGVNGGGYKNPRGRLRSLGLVDYREGKVIAKDYLFI